MKAWHIVQFRTAHVTAESRKYQSLKWVAKPNKHDGLGFNQIAASEDRDLLYAGWSLLLEVASKGPPETWGWLVRSGRALDAQDLALMTRWSKGTFDKVLEFFSRPGMGWLEHAEFPAGPAPASLQAPGDSPGVAGDSAGPAPASLQAPGKNPRNGTERYGTKSTEEREGGAPPSLRTSLADVQASRTQAGALLAQIRDLDSRKGDLTAEERAELRKKRGDLRALQKKQAAGEFAPVPNV